jgi:hypothetical protein
MESAFRIGHNTHSLCRIETIADAGQRNPEILDARNRVRE